MKHFLYIALALLPCLAWAQYPSNGNQKITLGEQTTADGLIYRGVASDTTLTAKSDTAAYFVLDTVNKKLYFFKASATPKWNEISGSGGGGTGTVTSIIGGTGLTGGTITTSGTLAADTNFLVTRYDTSAMLTPYWRSSNFSGTLPVANGGTGASSFSPNNYLIRTNSSGVFDTSAIYEANGNVGIGTNTPSTILTVSSIGFTDTKFRVEQRRNGIASEMAMVGANDDGARFNRFNSQTNGNNIFHWQIGGGGAINTMAMLTANIERMRITSDGEVGIGTTTPQSGYRLHVVDNVYVGGNVSASAYTTRSDYNLKDDIFDLKYGLNDILQLQPVEYTYKSNGSKQLGFIAQDIGTILPEVVSFEDSMSVNYQAIIPILTKAIQEQQALIKALEQRIINLENK